MDDTWEGSWGDRLAVHSGSSRRGRRGRNPNGKDRRGRNRKGILAATLGNPQREITRDANKGLNTVGRIRESPKGNATWGPIGIQYCGPHWGIPKGKCPGGPNRDSIRWPALGVSQKEIPTPAPQGFQSLGPLWGSPKPLCHAEPNVI